jgi:hypothetical protein
MLSERIRQVRRAFAAWIAATTLVACFQLPLETQDAQQTEDGSDAHMAGKAGVDAGTGVGDTGQGGGLAGGAGGDADGSAGVAGNAAGAGGGTAGAGGGAAGAGGTAGTGGIGVCSAGTKRCEGSQLEACDGQAWVLGQNCEHGCNASRKECNQCAPNALSCSAGTVYACSATGLLSTTACAFGCIANACRECLNDGDIKCDDNRISTCTQGRWGTALLCPDMQLCQAGQGCVCPAGTVAFAAECLSHAGNFDQFSYGGTMSAGFLGGQRVQLSLSSTLRALAVISTAANGTKVKLGLYRDNNGTPTTLVAETAATPLVVGRNHVAVTPVGLTAGAYWIMALYDNTASLRQDLNTSPHRSTAHSFNSALPSNLSGSSASTAAALNYYMLID